MKSKSLRGSRKSQSGFTLVEIAIVLVIIGLLLGGVLKGQELIENARVRNAVTDLNGVTAAYNGYVDRFKRIPGDDGVIATLNARGGSWAAVTAAGDADSALDIPAAEAFVPIAANESTAFWQHLKASGFLSGSPADTGAAALPRNAFNGLMAVFNNTTALTGAPAGTVICLSQVPGKAARQLDAQLDDGIVGSGSVRGTLSAAAGTNETPAAAAGAAYTDASQYTVCKSL